MRVVRAMSTSSATEWDKDWEDANNYINGPLFEATPNELCGIEGSPAGFYKQRRSSISPSIDEDNSSSSDTIQEKKKSSRLDKARAFFRPKSHRHQTVEESLPCLPTDLPTPPSSPRQKRSSETQQQVETQLVPPPSRTGPNAVKQSPTHVIEYPSPLRLNPIYPGDMSHRPLDQLKADHRRADRRYGGGHRRAKSSVDSDVIDGLDTIGGIYHHGGPYDATLAGMNRNNKYSPVAAVQASNEEALKATPQEFITDSLEQHVPLQGTGIIPPGGRDPRGRVMNYEEGADLMREADAPGGAYKRWDNVNYLPEDLKGKGEPSYTLERDMKQKDRIINPAGDYELQTPRKSRRHRSSSNVEEPTVASGSGVQRSHTVGKKIGDVRERLHLKKKPVASEREL